MDPTWWQQRQWSFVADMSGDGAVGGADMLAWLQWLFFMPGDAAIAALGPTPFGAAIGLEAWMFGSPVSAAVSVAGWLLAAWLVVYIKGFLQDVADPTWRQQQRERKAAERARQRIGRDRAFSR